MAMGTDSKAQENIMPEIGKENILLGFRAQELPQAQETFVVKTVIRVVMRKAKEVGRSPAIQ